MVCFDLLTKFDFSVMKLQTFMYMYFYFITESDFFNSSD